MLNVSNPFSKRLEMLSLPDNTFVVDMAKSGSLKDIRSELVSHLENPIGTESLRMLACKKKKKNVSARACIVVSDNTRPVPYKGQDGILVPIVDILNQAGFLDKEIVILVANGMHKPMTDDELRNMIDEEIFQRDIQIVNHESDNEESLSFIGTTARGTDVYVNSGYLNADLKILTGLVEPHFMAGASGGRKSICPGLIGKKSTRIFHGPDLMSDDKSRNLVIADNPVHQESLEIAKLAGVDFIVNVTLDRDFKITGIFTGDLEKAHSAAVEKIKEDVEVCVLTKFDIVITHGGFVGINHYQCAKCAVASLGALKAGGYLIVIADTTDEKDVIGSVNYKTSLALLRHLGPKRFLKLIKSKDWVFLPEQWQVQQWAKVFSIISEDNFYFYSPQIDSKDFELLPGVDMKSLGSVADYNDAIMLALIDIERRTGKKTKDLDICYLAQGPYEIPMVK